MHIWYISDAKAGHMSQAKGLFKALQQRNVDIHVLEIPFQQISKIGLICYWLSGGIIGQLPLSITGKPSPQLIMGIGHKTHWSVLLLKKIFKSSKSLVLMQPSLPDRCFDFLIIPEHDHPKPHSRTLATKGVLNPLHDEQRHQEKHCLILIGGASKRHGWSDQLLIAQMNQLFTVLVNYQIILTTSRRTPEVFLTNDLFVNPPANVQILPVNETPQGWLFEQLQLASLVWVTEDSVSMLYEALTAGCQVGILNMPRLKQDRITRSVDSLLQQKKVFTLEQFQQSLANELLLSNQPVSLNEADRAASWLLTQLLPQLRG